jgi:hypothetical protein
MTPSCPQSTWLCCCSSFNCSACAHGTRMCYIDLLFLTLPLAPPPLLSRPLNARLLNAYRHLLLTCCTLYNHCDYYLTLLVIYEHLNILKNNLALMTMCSYNIYPAQLEEDWPPLRAWFHPRYRASKSALLAVWGFRLGFCIALTSADVKRAL